jgi:hypothetical protein
MSLPDAVGNWDQLGLLGWNWPESEPCLTWWSQITCNGENVTGM